MIRRAAMEQWQAPKPLRYCQSCGICRITGSGPCDECGADDFKAATDPTSREAKAPWVHRSRIVTTHRDYSDMSREQLEAHTSRIAQLLADDRAHQFWTRYALGPLSAPSCICCGQLPAEVAVQHLEIPGVVVCKACKDSATGAAS